ncbi:MAG: Na(+)-translocating NADH-quinone reductase subunit A [Planctomycetota bacterium]|jgi:Na+-transporting NADH:ubiquinone oxidoreductase subunit A
MGLHSTTKGLDLPITGKPIQKIDIGRPITRVALMAEDYVGMRPKLYVNPGDKVKRGQLLFEDKKTPWVRYISPAAGTFIAINRGQRRVLQSVVVQLSDSERQGTLDDDERETFTAYNAADPATLTSDQIKALLIESGMWTALRARPFGRVANPETVPHSIFVTAMDTNPMAASVDTVLADKQKDFEIGLRCVSKLTEGKTFLCKAPGSQVTAPADTNIQTEEFKGPHPAGTVGVHIHTLDPVGRGKIVWYLNYQDVSAIGRLVTTGILDVERVVSLAGPTVKNPRLLKTRMGAWLDELVKDELEDGENRLISGSVLSGRTASGESLGYLGRYHLQISVLQEGRERQLLSWAMPGMNKFSIIGAYISKLFPKKKYNFTTNRNGGQRAIVPIGMYERVMPMDILPTFLLRSLVVGDLEQAERLGCMELEEEDLSLCTFVCPGKIDYGPYLRNILTEIEKEG